MTTEQFFEAACEILADDFLNAKAQIITEDSGPVSVEVKEAFNGNLNRGTVVYLAVSKANDVIEGGEGSVDIQALKNQSITQLNQMLQTSLNS